MRLTSVLCFFAVCSLTLGSMVAWAQAQTTIPKVSDPTPKTIHSIDRSALPNQNRQGMKAKALAKDDTHTYARPTDAVITHLDLDVTVNFDKEVVKGEATYQFKRTTGNTLMLDTRGLDIASVSDQNNAPLRFKQLANDSIRGQALVIVIEENTTRVKVSYATTEASVGLQWLSAEQNDGKTPFLYSQGQAILTRSWIPIQDSPAIRITYNAKVTVPAGMVAVMSALGNVQQRNPKQTTFEFKQPYTIPAYLIALAVGNLDFKKITDNAGIYALPAVLSDAANEFQEVGKMLGAAEKLCGPYEWQRFDILVLPASFPFGGMENPMLTFATPTILAGDRSLVSLIVHELVHSWSGNLVTNANWNDFWLNEGWTVYLERRIVEMLYGKEMANMMEVLGFQDLKATIADMPKGSIDASLRLQLQGRDPDDGMTDVAYERGAMVIKNLETAWGRVAFDPFIRTYFKDHKFQSLTTDQFVTYATKYAKASGLEMPDLFGMTIAIGEPQPDYKVFSERMMGIEKARMAFLSGKAIADFGVAKWTTQERQYFLRILTEPLTQAQLQTIEGALQLQNSKNSEVNFEWYLICIRSGHNAIRPQLDEFLGRVGRRKFILPLYKAMFEQPLWNEWASERYEVYRNRYHNITSSLVDRLM